MLHGSPSSASEPSQRALRASEEAEVCPLDKARALFFCRCTIRAQEWGDVATLLRVDNELGGPLRAEFSDQLIDVLVLGSKPAEVHDRHWLVLVNKRLIEKIFEVFFGNLLAK